MIKHGQAANYICHIYVAAIGLTRLKQSDKLVIKYDKAANHTYTIVIAETCEMVQI